MPGMLAALRGNQDQPTKSVVSRVSLTRATTQITGDDVATAPKAVPFQGNACNDDNEEYRAVDLGMWSR